MHAPIPRYPDTPIPRYQESSQHPNTPFLSLLAQKRILPTTSPVYRLEDNFKMSTHTKNLLSLFVLAIIGFMAVRFILHLAISILVSLIPLALVVGGIYVAYQVFGKKALGSGRRTLP